LNGAAEFLWSYSVPEGLFLQPLSIELSDHFKGLRVSGSDRTSLCQLGQRLCDAPLIFGANQGTRTCAAFLVLFADRFDELTGKDSRNVWRANCHFDERSLRVST